MSPADRKKLAKAARELASEYAEGNGPTITNWNSWCGCLAGALIKRVPLAVQASVLPSWLDESVEGALSRATSYFEDPDCYIEHGEVNPGRIAPVFPLLWLADELESQP